MTTHYYYDGDELLYTTDGDEQINCFNVIGDSDNYAATIRYDNGLQYYTYNKNVEGSITNVVDESGNGVVSYQYTDFGITTILGDTDFYNEICYASAVYDASTGLYYMGARYYDPEDGRFLTQDSYRGTAADYGTWNLYTYCANNPVKYIDPSGHSFLSVSKLVKKAAKAVKKKVRAVKKAVKSAAKKVKSKATATVKKVVKSAKKAASTVQKAATVVKKATKKAVKAAKKFSKTKKGKILIGTAVIGVCAAATVLTGEACAGVAGAVAAGALKGAVIGAAAGAVGGGITSAAGYALANGSLAGSSGAILDGAASGYETGAITGAITGAASGYLEGPHCFVAGTEVITAAGVTAIEEIKTGDLVLAENPQTGELAYKKVLQTFKNSTRELTHVRLRSDAGLLETIDTTPKHSFYVEGKGWVEASALHPGMTIWYADGTKGRVEDISSEGLAEPVFVYNFIVEDFHTYFVGNGVLVHNGCETSGVLESESVTAESSTEWKRMTSRESNEVAEKLGFKKVRNQTMRNGEPIYYNKKTKRCISQDIGSGNGLGSHNGGVWKMAKRIDDLRSKTTRMGTYNIDLSIRIGD